MVKWKNYVDDHQYLLVAATYEIQYRELEKEDAGKIITVSGETSIAVIDNLSDAQNYEVKGYTHEMRWVGCTKIFQMHVFQHFNYYFEKV